MFLEVKVFVNNYAKIFVGVNYGYKRPLVHLGLDTWYSGGRSVF